MGLRPPCSRKTPILLLCTRSLCSRWLAGGSNQSRRRWLGWKMQGFLGSGGELFLPMSRPLHRPPSPTWALLSWTDLYAIFKFLCCDIWFLKNAWPVFEMCLVLPLKGKCLDLNQWHVRQNHIIASSYYCTWNKNSHAQCCSNHIQKSKMSYMCPESIQQFKWSSLASATIFLEVISARLIAS